MSKKRPSKLDPFADQLRQWLGAEQKTYDQVVKLLKDEWDCRVSRSAVAEWWAAEERQAAEDKLFSDIANGSRQAREVAERFKDSPPDLAPVIKLVESLIMKLAVSGELGAQAKLLPALVDRLIDYEKIQLGKRGMTVDEEKLKILQKKAEQLDAAKEVVEDTQISDEERMLRIRQKLGMTP